MSTEKRARTVLTGGLVAMSLLAWAYTIYLSSTMRDMSMDSDMLLMPGVGAWHLEDAIFTFLMWLIMMVAMMIPSAMPMILAFERLSRQRGSARPLRKTSLFLLGYVIIWAGFSLLAALLQWGLHSALLLQDSIMAVSATLGGLILILAGLYQLTPLKHACLAVCRSPLSFLITEWRDGTIGALLMGIRHGGFCAGCCWLLMVILFVSGVMNLLWVAVLTLLVLVEKVIPAGHLAGRIAGFAIMGWGAALLVSAL